MGGGGGQVKFHPYKKGMGTHFCSHAEGGGTQNVFR